MSTAWASPIVAGLPPTNHPPVMWQECKLARLMDFPLGYLGNLRGYSWRRLVVFSFRWKEDRKTWACTVLPPEASIAHIQREKAFPAII